MHHDPAEQQRKQETRTAKETQLHIAEHGTERTAKSEIAEQQKDCQKTEQKGQRFLPQK